MALCAADEPDAREVEEVRRTSAVRSASQTCAVPVLPPTPVARDDRSVVVPRTLLRTCSMRPHQLRELVGLRTGASRVLRRPSRRRRRPTTCGVDQDPAVHRAPRTRRELDLGDRHALAERAVREVDLAPRLDRRVVDEAADLAGDVDARSAGRTPARARSRGGSPSASAVVSPRPSATFAATTLRE